MPDISMCQDTECPDRMKCRRFTAKPSERQNYTANLREAWDTRCMLFILAPGAQIKSLEATR
jgi:hypothetical protein